MSFILSLSIDTLAKVWHTLLGNWPYLVVSALFAALLTVYMDLDRISTFLRRYRRAGVVAATAAAVGTPLCSCGTMAVILGMMAGMMPWAPIVAFLVSSPLTSPQELIYSAGLFGWPFALTFFAASIVLGLAGGLMASLMESRGLLANQARFVMECCAEATNRAASKGGPLAVLTATFHAGRRLLVLFVVFAFVGYFLNGLIPAHWIPTLFGGGKVYSVPLAATLALPFYINTEASLPLVRALLDGGMSQGAALAFLITGAGTSFGALAGALTVARWRVVGLVIATLWVGAICFGFAYDGLLAAGLP
ncbi:MAG: permease [Anaerolineae bacterium]|nr:permease [Anaerolineae bacterium]